MQMLKNQPRKLQLCVLGTILTFGAFCALAVRPIAAQVQAAQVQAVGPPPATTGWRAATIVKGLRYPRAIVWLRDGRAIIASKGGTLHVVTNGRLQRIPVDGLPRLFTGGQGGLIDIALHPDYGRNGWIYMTLSTGTESSNRATLVRGTFDGRRVRGVRTLFQVTPDKSGDQHFGSRLLWLPDRTLLMSYRRWRQSTLRVGNMLAREQAQNLRSHLGSILRLTDSGRPAPNNPLLGAAAHVRDLELWPS
jgi:glucose/arabinose dehydrogenase